MVERLALNQQVRGSKPLSPAIGAYSKFKKDNNFSFQEKFKWFESIKSSASSYMSGLAELVNAPEPKKMCLGPKTLTARKRTVNPAP